MEVKTDLRSICGWTGGRLEAWKYNVSLYTPGEINTTAADACTNVLRT